MCDIYISDKGGQQDDDAADDTASAFDLGRGVSYAHKKNLLRCSNNFPFFPAFCFLLFSVLNAIEQVQKSNIYVKYRSVFLMRLNFDYEMLFFNFDNIGKVINFNLYSLSLYRSRAEGGLYTIQLGSVSSEWS